MAPNHSPAPLATWSGHLSDPPAELDETLGPWARTTRLCAGCEP